MAPNRKVDRLLSSRMLESPSSVSSSLFVLESYSGTSSPFLGSLSAVSTSSSFSFTTEESEPSNKTKSTLSSDI